MLTIDEIKRFIAEDKSDSRKYDARIAQRYYEAEHDIKNYKLYYYDAEENLVEDKTRSNIKISHPFFTELVDQCIQYLFSGDEPYARSDDPKLQKVLDEAMNENDDFNSELSDCMTDAKVKGSGYLYLYKNKDGKISVQCADSLSLIEVRAKETQDKCDYVILYYVERIGKNHQPITKIEVWDKDKAWFYVQDGEGKIEEDKDADHNPRPHILYTKGDDETLYYDSFGQIPFFRLDNNKKRTSDLKPIKALIDDYDLMSCGLSNNLQDITEGLYVISGFDGDNLDELIKNIRTKKTIGLGENGGVDIKTINIPYEARKVKLQEDEKNIYRFGMGLNSSQVGDGNITNVVIKSRYALLDLKCDKFEIKLRQFLKRIVEVILDDYNKSHDTAYRIEQVYFRFERNIITNEADSASIKHTEAQTRQVNIQTLLMLLDVIGTDEMRRLICEQLDLDYEEIKDKLPDIQDNPEEEMDGLEDLLNGGNDEQ